MLQPDWRNRPKAHLPPFPGSTVRRMVAEFGVDPAVELDPWPHGPSDILARFPHLGRPHLLKGRHVEQRGERSLFETHRLQQLLRQEGLAVPALLAAPSGDTLVKGPDWEEAGAALYYEIQEEVSGGRFAPTADRLRRAGALIARFHGIGAGIDTFLLNKSTYISVFRQRGLEARRRLRDRLLGAGLGQPERQPVERFFDRHSHPSLQAYLDWRIVHGDLTIENILANEDDLHLVDWDEVGLCPKVSDHGDLLGSLAETDEVSVRAVIDGYREAKGHLEAPDLEAIHNGLVLGGLRQLGEEPDSLNVGPVFDRYAFLLRY